MMVAGVELVPYELTMLTEYAFGKTAKEIAVKHNCCLQSVYNALSRITVKLGAKHLGNAVFIATQNGMIDKTSRYQIDESGV